MNITLIGMAGAGKSFVGEKLAAALNFSFVDTDKQMEEHYKMPLQDILDVLGEEKFLEVEAREVISLGDREHAVIAPGGSIIYSQEAIQYLKRCSKIVYLAALPDTIEKRIDTKSRGIVGLGNKSFADLYAERKSAYEDIADIQINTEALGADEIVMQIRKSLRI